MGERPNFTPKPAPLRCKHRGPACVYCGTSLPKGGKQREHVVTDSLYPPLLRAPEFGLQLLTVPACAGCNRSFQDDEVEFRNLISPTTDTLIAKELQAATTRSFWPPPELGGQPDGERRFRDLLKYIRIIDTPRGPRHAIYPGESPKVLRVVRKMVRGLSYALGLPWPVSDQRVWAQLRTEPIPDDVFRGFIPAYFIAGVNDISYARDPAHRIHSMWSLTFLDRVRFFAVVGSLDEPFNPRLLWPESNRNTVQWIG